jgi:uracil-DNA glycosylase
LKETLEDVVAAIRACRHCVERPVGQPLPHDPRPVLQVTQTARIAIFSQAPGLRVHESGRPFTDASGERLRAWLGMDEATFYDASKVAIAPMGFCFPGYSSKGADLPPRKECAPLWRARLIAAAPRFAVAILVGSYAIGWHLQGRAKPSLSETVAAWRDYSPAFFVLPHPSWRNNGWLRRHPWFEAELLPALRSSVTEALAPSGLEASS